MSRDRHIYFHEHEVGPEEPSKVVISMRPPLGKLASRDLCDELTSRIPKDAQPIMQAAKVTCEDEEMTTLVVTGADSERFQEPYQVAKYMGSLITALGAHSNTTYWHVLDDYGTSHPASGETHQCSSGD
jgi:hypothetical protein